MGLGDADLLSALTVACRGPRYDVVVIPPEYRPWRAHPLDGALLWFHPSTGTHVRWDAPATRGLRRRAPRVVMFGITNRCNLACGFCSRDLAMGSEWSAESAFEVLSGLAREGVLEVAFGGGEPLVFRGFDELLARLAAETPLAVHFTTNGTLLTEERLSRLRGNVGEIRLSVYDDNPWAERVAMLAGSGVQFGVNLLVTPARIPGLPDLLGRLAALGCRDVALLSYVGPDPHLHLDAPDEKRLREIIAKSPVRARLSVCFGDRLDPVPRLFDGVDGDCGAGVDFLALTSDCKVKACSFQDHAVPARTAVDVMNVWRARRPELLGATSRAGCARARPRPVGSKPSDGLRIWRAFSGNNSGECVMVGRFERPEDAAAYLAELLPGFRPGSPFSDEWRQLLAAEGIELGESAYSPDAMAVVGPTVMVETDSALGDDYPSLRTLLWKRGGRAVCTGIHVHGAVMLAVALRLPDVKTLDDVEALLAIDDVGDFQRRGLDLYGLVPHIPVRPGPESLEGRVAYLEALAGKHGAALAAELVPTGEGFNLAKILAAPPPAEEPEWLWAHFGSAEEAQSVARTLDGTVTVVGQHLLVAAARISKRVGWYVQSRGGSAELLFGPRLKVTASFHAARGFESRMDGVWESLRARLDRDDRLSLHEGEYVGASLIETQQPGAVLSAVAATATERSIDFWIQVEPSPDRLVHAFARLARDLKRVGGGGLPPPCPPPERTTGRL